jgi:hypothetical protein
MVAEPNDILRTVATFFACLHQIYSSSSRRPIVRDSDLMRQGPMETPLPDRTHTEGERP